DEAIDIVNEVDYGLTSGLHSLDRDEIAIWLDRVRAGNLYVNRGITGAIVGRQPFGGWKRSAVGPGAKAGGVNYLVPLGSWRSTPAEAGITPTNREVDALLERSRPYLSEAEQASLQRSAASDAKQWRDHFNAPCDRSSLEAEHNVARYVRHPVPLTVRFGAGAPAGLVRVVVAAATTGARVALSLAPQAIVGDALQGVLRSTASVLSLELEDDASFASRLCSLDGGRVRLIGAEPSAIAEAIAGRADIAVYSSPVTEAGRVELLPFLREQTVSVTAHRFGMPSQFLDHLI
ncbi:MAG: aldehyde dehydrogenase family protein, partial [Acidimicrobiales bacterium]|nr:aldehyde dehydrogenase family protein [Acidimicrobiales bacterium]